MFSVYLELTRPWRHTLNNLLCSVYIQHWPIHEDPNSTLLTKKFAMFSVYSGLTHPQRPIDPYDTLLTKKFAMFSVYSGLTHPQRPIDPYDTSLTKKFAMFSVYSGLTHPWRLTWEARSSTPWTSSLSWKITWRRKGEWWSYGVWQS